MVDTVLSTAYSSIFFNQLEPASWAPSVRAAWWYRWSSFTYCWLGLFTLFRCDRDAPLSQYESDWYPWHAVGLVCCVVGLTSYMADTYTWGRLSLWKNVDRLVACLLYLFGLSMAGFQIFGVFAFPTSVTVFFTANLFVGLWCKTKSAAALVRNEEQHYFVWHTAWHVSIPTACIICLSWLDWLAMLGRAGTWPA